MAQSLDNVVMHGMQGTLAGMLVIRNRAGKTVVCKRPKYKKGAVPTVKQQAVRDKFGIAALYATKAILDVAVKESYEAVAQPGQSAYNLAFADAFIAPKVLSISNDSYKGVPGNIISLTAKDDFKVVSVKVSIHTAAGVLIEEGLAVESKGAEWLYAVTAANPDAAGSVIKATALDLPGNEGSLSIII